MPQDLSLWFYYVLIYGLLSVFWLRVTWWLVADVRRRSRHASGSGHDIAG
jgi:uncharacterized membrane protein